MVCFTPLSGHRAPGGRITFKAKEGWSGLPAVQVPCGQCQGCRLERSRQWATRCVHEAELHKRNCFITLTYDPKSLPADLSLDVREWQLFAKRLRKRLGPFRFLHCGEYGEENRRPHYHACLFGVDFAEDRVLWKETDGRRMYTSALLSEIWGRGFTTVGDLTWSSAAYVSRYIMKKMTGDAAEEHYMRFDSATGECWQVKPEYVTMSRRPGLGHGWFQRFKGDVFPSGFVVHNGRKFRPPRYYDSLLEEDERSVLQAKRREVMQSFKGETSPERLRVREAVAESRISKLTRGV